MYIINQREILFLPNRNYDHRLRLCHCLDKTIAVVHHHRHLVFVVAVAIVVIDYSSAIPIPPWSLVYPNPKQSR